MEIRAYHGTSLEFEAFSLEYAGGSSCGGAGTDEGIFLAEVFDHAEYWANHSAAITGMPARILECTAQVERVLEFDAQAFCESDHPMAGNPVQHAIDIARGEHDAIRFLNCRDIPESDAVDFWFVFDPSAITINAVNA